jgi:ABC-type multidrug transport system ATPase subunit
VSILFADEPTSGLDASAASVIMRGLKRIAQSGRAVCCTIHQPSIAIFNDFDELLLLKRGGETVFFGELGKQSSLLIEYLERFDATPKIHPGENPATWMLTTIGAGSSSTNAKPFDYAGSYSQSKLREQCIERIYDIRSVSSDENKVVFPSEYATSYATQSSVVFSRTIKVYFRSPNYNVTRVMVAIIGKFWEETANLFTYILTS